MGSTLGIRTERTPDAAATHGMMDDLFRLHWPERVQRLLVPDGHGSYADSDGTWIECAPGQVGTALYGPYMPLRAGRYRVTWQVRTPDASPPAATFDVVAGPDATPLARCEVRSGDSCVSVDFELPETTFGLQFRCQSTGGAGFLVLRMIELEDNPAQYR